LYYFNQLRQDPKTTKDLLVTTASDEDVLSEIVEELKDPELNTYMEERVASKVKRITTSNVLMAKNNPIQKKDLRQIDEKLHSYRVRSVVPSVLNTYFQFGEIQTNKVQIYQSIVECPNCCHRFESTENQRSDYIDDGTFFQQYLEEHVKTNSKETNTEVCLGQDEATQCEIKTDKDTCDQWTQAPMKHSTIVQQTESERGFSNVGGVSQRMGIPLTRNANRLQAAYARYDSLMRKLQNSTFDHNISISFPAITLLKYKGLEKLPKEAQIAVIMDYECLMEILDKTYKLAKHKDFLKMPPDKLSSYYHSARHSINSINQLIGMYDSSYSADIEETDELVSKQKSTADSAKTDGQPVLLSFDDLKFNLDDMRL
jgi:hypothetical protein